ncbi:unnamed protein product [Larinioides sclopetarius]|uniref:Uncharacterized protein n=1 Tax=Larinioides sclopetarius TaxID=280406 RepID=A0AAV2B371_9ARAC
MRRNLQSLRVQNHDRDHVHHPQELHFSPPHDYDRKGMQASVQEVHHQFRGPLQRSGLYGGDRRQLH